MNVESLGSRIANQLRDAPVLTGGTGIVAYAGGTRDGATLLYWGVNEIDSVPFTGASVLLPRSETGKVVIVINSGANSARLYAQDPDTVNWILGSQGVLQGPGTTMIFTCPKTGKWMSAGSGASMYGALANGVWHAIPSIWRLRLTGTGTVTLDSVDSLGNVTSAFDSYSVAGATDDVEFPFAGTNAVAVRATLLGAVTAEII